jgi:transposase
MPRRAARETVPIIATGIAIRRGQGVAITITARNRSGSPLIAHPIAAIVTDPRHFDSGRDFAASLGLVPRQDGTGGKVKLGPISKRGNGYLRRLLVNGATAVLNGKNARNDPWRAKMLDGKPRKLVAVALANKMARIAWAVMTRQEDFRPRAVPA